MAGIFRSMSHKLETAPARLGALVAALSFALALAARGSGAREIPSLWLLSDVPVAADAAASYEASWKQFWSRDDADAAIEFLTYASAADPIGHDPGYLLVAPLEHVDLRGVVEERWREALLASGSLLGPRRMRLAVRLPELSHQPDGTVWEGSLNRSFVHATFRIAPGRGFLAAVVCAARAAELHVDECLHGLTHVRVIRRAVGFDERLAVHF